MCACQSDTQARHHRRAFRGPAPSQITACAPQARIVPPKRGLCPYESNRLDAIGVQFEVRDSQNIGHHPRICGLEPLFRRFHGEDLFFVFTPESVEFRTCFAMKTFFFGLHSRQSFCAPPKLFMPPPPPSHAALAPGLLTLTILFCMMILNM